jgi:hypothetical protein
MRKQIIDALHTFAKKRPGLDPRDYVRSWDDREGRSTYRAEARNITRDLTHARALLRRVELSGITSEEIIEASRWAFSGRLTITATDDGIVKVNYCVGQYFPTEYRKAVSSVCARALWNYWRDGSNDADRIRNTARREFSRAIARAYFN